MKTRILAILLFAVTLGFSTAADAPSALSLRKGDVRSVQLDLKPDEMPKLNIYFTREKLAEVRSLIAANLNRPISIEMNGKVAARPRISQPLQYKNRFLTLGFPDVESALHAALILVPSR